MGQKQSKSKVKALTPATAIVPHQQVLPHVPLSGSQVVQPSAPGTYLIHRSKSLIRVAQSVARSPALQLTGKGAPSPPKPPASSKPKHVVQQEVKPLAITPQQKPSNTNAENLVPVPPPKPPRQSVLQSQQPNPKILQQKTEKSLPVKPAPSKTKKTTTTAKATPSKKTAVFVPSTRKKKKGCCSRLCSRCCSCCCRKKSKVHPAKVYTELSKPPSSLSHLKDVSSFLLRSSHDRVEHNCEYDIGAKFDVYHDDSYLRNRRLYTAVEEESGCECCRICVTACLRTDRPFRFRILDEQLAHVFTVVRPCSCCCFCGGQFCGDTCGHGLRIELPDGIVIGTVTQKYSCCKPVLMIHNEVGNPRFKINGPPCGFCFCCRICCPPAQIPIVALEDSLIWRKGDEIGAIGMKPPVPAAPGWPLQQIARNNFWWQKSRQQEQQDSEFHIDAEEIVFWVDFPQKLDVRLKATILGAALLIDFLLFDKDPCGLTQFCC